MTSTDSNLDKFLKTIAVIGIIVSCIVLVLKFSHQKFSSKGCLYESDISSEKEIVTFEDYSLDTEGVITETTPLNTNPRVEMKKGAFGNPREEFTNAQLNMEQNNHVSNEDYRQDIESFTGEIGESSFYSALSVFPNTHNSLENYKSKHKHVFRGLQGLETGSPYTTNPILEAEATGQINIKEHNGLQDCCIWNGRETSTPYSFHSPPPNTATCFGANTKKINIFHDCCMCTRIETERYDCFYLILHLICMKERHMSDILAIAEPKGLVTKTDLLPKDGGACTPPKSDNISTEVDSSEYHSCISTLDDHTREMEKSRDKEEPSILQTSFNAGNANKTDEYSNEVKTVSTEDIASLNHQRSECFPTFPWEKKIMDVCKIWENWNTKTINKMIGLVKVALGYKNDSI